MCWMPSFFVSLFSFDWFNSPATFAATSNVDFIFGWLISWLLTIFIHGSSVYLALKYSQYWLSRLHMSLQFVTGLFLLLSLSISGFGCCILYIFSTSLAFQSIFLIYYNLQLIMPKLYLNPGTANAPIAVISLLACKSDFSIILNPYPTNVENRVSS